jgi:biopolymer transport protein ExbD
VFQSIRLKRRSPRQPEISIAPLIDMVFILLIFFIVTTSFVSQTGLTVEKPQSRSSETLEEDSLLIGIGPLGEIYLDGNRIGIFSLRGQVETRLRRQSKPSVVLVADKAASAEVIVRVMDELRLSGISRVALATRQKDK